MVLFTVFSKSGTGTMSVRDGGFISKAFIFHKIMELSLNKVRYKFVRSIVYLGNFKCFHAQIYISDVNGLQNNFSY